MLHSVPRNDKKAKKEMEDKTKKMMEELQQRQAQELNGVLEVVRIFHQLMVLFISS
jgi:hypothetical protein